MLKILVLTLILLVSFPENAFAFTVNKFIRVPDWMDFYLFLLALGVVISLIFVALTKPSSVPMNELYKHASSLSPATNFARFFAVVCLGLFFVLFFIGMGLVRMA